jgi:hypothetical protein
MDKLNILLLCNRPTRNSQAGTVFDHLDSFHKYSCHNIFELSTIHSIPKSIDLDRFDVVVVHYTLGIGFEHFISQETKDQLAQSRAIKIVFIQDEYRIVDKVITSLKNIDVDILFTCVPTSEISKVYLKKDFPGVEIINNLCGYVPEVILQDLLPKFNDRPIDIGYRTRKTPFWLGKLGAEKWMIVDKIQKYCIDKGLTVDLSYNESDRIYGSKWPKFLASCKSVLGVESGASVFDFSGLIQTNVEDYVSIHPNAEFEEVYDKFLSKIDGKIRLNQISPRFFEAIICRTLMILYEGEYSGILTPWKHYVPLKKDFTNIDEVLSVLQNSDQAQKIIDTAYRDIVVSNLYSYKKFIKIFDTTTMDFVENSKRRREKPCYSKMSYQISLYTNLDYLLRYLISYIFQKVVLGVPLFRKYIFQFYFSLPIIVQRKIRPVTRFINK